MRIRMFFMMSVTIICCFSVYATTYYVDAQHNSANDSNPGTINLPWKTIQHSAETAIAGDTVLIRTGQYHESVYFDQAGNSVDGSIVYAAYPGENPVIDGTGVNDANNGIVLDKDYIMLSGLEICNWNENGIWIESAALFELSDCVVHDVFYGIGIADGSHDFTFNRVEVYRFSLYGFDASPSGGSICYNGTFNDCISHTGRDPEQNVDGFALGHGDQHDFTLNRCTTYAVYDGFDISARNTMLNRCLAYDCGNGCYKLWQDQVSLINCIGYNSEVSIVELDWDEQPGRTMLMNCTFFNSQTFTIWIENQADTLMMHNCILAGGDNIGLAFEQYNAKNYIGDYNLFHNDNSMRAIAVGYTDEFSLDQASLEAWHSYSGQDGHSIVAQSATEIFIDPSQHNFQLFPGSPAVDHGITVNAPTDDFAGTPRSGGTGVDIGAYEYQPQTGLSDNHKNDCFSKSPILEQNYPNPFNAHTTIRYSFTETGRARIVIYNVRGQQVRLLVNELHQPGQYTAQWDGCNEVGNPVVSGIYLCQLMSGKTVRTTRLLYLK